MSQAVPQYIDAEVERRVAQRTADLNELLGYLHTCWDEERRLLARKMHDSLGSSMTALTMHLALLTQQMPAEKALLERSAQMKQLLATIIDTNREMQLSLWNDKLEFLGVKAAISDLVNQFGATSALATHSSLPDDDIVCERVVAVALLRCVEEGLRNVRSHAGASEVNVILDDNDEQIMLTIRDNGRGPSALPAPAAHCHGLRLLHERARYLGGTLNLAPVAHGGTVLTLILPKAGSAFSAA